MLEQYVRNVGRMVFRGLEALDGIYQNNLRMMLHKPITILYCGIKLLTVDFWQWRYFNAIEYRWPRLIFQLLYP
jgi:hypothetical protein